MAGLLTFSFPVAFPSQLVGTVAGFAGNNSGDNSSGYCPGFTPGSLLSGFLYYAGTIIKTKIDKNRFNGF